MKIWIGTVLILAGFLDVAMAASGALTPTDLRCEYRKTPLGIDAPQPRLSWILAPGNPRARGLRQSAYQVVVASDRRKLDANEGDFWDSGKIASDQSIHVRYAGRPLGSQAECFWKVRAWDQDGNSSAWSKPARWTMGLLAASDWKGRWIGLDGDDQNGALAGTSWIWFPEGEPEKAAPIGTRYFRRSFELPAGRTIKSATWLVTGDNQFAAFVNGGEVGQGSNFKSATVLDVKSKLRPGRNVLAASVANTGDAPNPAGFLALLRVEFAAGEPLVLPTDENWRTADRESAKWLAPDFADSAWVAAKNLGAVGMAPWGQIGLPDDRRLPARWLRKEFVAERTLRRATAYWSGLGLSELYLNGRRVGDEVLSPALSEYSQRVFYVTHDVTGMIRSGANAVGVILGNGRYFAPRREQPTFTQTYGFPKLLFQLHLDYDDGSAADIVSDETWKLTTEGPIRANNEYDGEEYDARMELGNWASPGYDDEKWQPALLVAAPTFNPDSAGMPELGDGRPILGRLFTSVAGSLSAQMQEPIRVTGTIRPIALTEPRPGVFIFDLGQNMVGWCRLRVSGPRGTRVSLRHAETLQPDGTLYLANIRGAKVTDVYTLKGRGVETYEPRFTYHGFRYVEMTGFLGKPTLAAIEGHVVNDDLESAGEFACSQPMINRIYRNILWGVRGNYRSIPTDCPQRDERQGWLGDRSAESKGESYLFNTATLYAKWLQDMADSQKPNGSVSDVCPAYWPLYNDNVTWPSSTVIIPGTLLDQFADVGIIAQHYSSMVKWIDHMSGYLQDGLITKDNYGDWCVPPENPKLIHSQDPMRKTAAGILATSYFYYDLRLMARYATLLGRASDAERFNALAGQLKTALNARFLNRDRGQYDNGSQTSCVLPLAFDLAPADERPRIFDHLVNKITRETADHIGTGLVGGQWLNRVLTAGGRPDLAYTFVTNTTYPSWGYMVEKGATTIWELWNGDTADPAMNSGNHVMLVGDLVIWLYENLAGIKPDPEQPGFRHVLMRPTPVGDLQFVKASHRSPYGLIASEWQRAGGAFRWNVTVPPNTTATLWVPAKDAASVTESGRPAERARGLSFVRMDNGCAVFSAGSGRYAFVSR